MMELLTEPPSTFAKDCVRLVLETAQPVKLDWTSVSPLLPLISTRQIKPLPPEASLVAKFAVTLRARSMVRVSGLAFVSPVTSPLQPPNAYPLSATAVTVTLPPSACQPPVLLTEPFAPPAACSSTLVCHCQVSVASLVRFRLKLVALPEVGLLPFIAQPEATICVVP